MNYKFAKNITRESADMFLYDEIGWNEKTYQGISGQTFARELDYLANQEGIKRINVRINSPGGKMIDGYSILSSILNINQNKKGVWVDTYIDGVAASVAGWIAVAGKVVSMAEYGLLMMHNPSYAGGQALTDKDQEVLDKYKATIATIFKAKTGMSEADISKMMDSETWLDASEARELGFVDKIVSINALSKPLATENKNTVEIYQAYNSLLNKSPKMELNTEIAAALGVNNVGDAVKLISEQKAKIKAFETENSNLATSIANLETQVKDFEAKEKELVKQQATEMVENAIREQRINATEKNTWIELAVVNYEGTKKALNSIQPVKLSKVIEQNNATQAGTQADRNAWNYTKWAKEDPKGLEALAKEQPEVFNQITKTI